MTKQTDLNIATEKLQDELQKFIATNGKKSERIFKQLRGELTDILAAHADDSGKISRRKLNTLIKEFEHVLQKARTNLFDEITELVKDSADHSLTEMEKIFAREVGQSLIASTLHNKIIDEVVAHQVEQAADDRLLLSDRVWILTAEVHAALTTAVTASVLKNESLSQIMKAIREVHDNETWKIRRVAITEANTAARLATGSAAAKSNVVEAIKLNDKHRPHRNHASHRCYTLARANDYGLGTGVYPKEKYGLLAMPHPQCSAYISYVISDKYL